MTEETAVFHEDLMCSFVGVKTDRANKGLVITTRGSTDMEGCIRFAQYIYPDVVQVEVVDEKFDRVTLYFQCNDRWHSRRREKFEAGI